MYKYNFVINDNDIKKSCNDIIFSKYWFKTHFTIKSSIFVSLCFGLSFTLMFNIFNFIVQFLLLSIIFFVIYAYMKMCYISHAAYKIALKFNNTVSREVNITFNNENIEVRRGDDVSSSVKWNVIQHVENSKNGILIYLSSNQALQIPKRIFNTQEEVDNCFNIIQKLYNNAKQVRNNI